MDFYTPRKLRFKAWNKESRLMMRLNSIECVKGELMKKDHILLQFTGWLDQQGEELYELDVVLIDGVRHVITWSEENSGWCLKTLEGGRVTGSLERQAAQRSVRLWSYFESERNL